MDSDNKNHDPISDGCEIGLSLGLLTPTFNTKKEKSVSSSLKFDHVLPCLSLGPLLADHPTSPESSSYNNNNNNNNNNNSGFMKRTTSDQEKELGGCNHEEEVGDDDVEEEASPRKKLRLTKNQSAVLEDTFKQHTTLNPVQKDALAKQLNLRPRQVEVWFQNRRARTKLKQTETECETVKKLWEKLTEDNKRLQEELFQLRSSSGAIYLQIPAPASVISVCPSCNTLINTASPPVFKPSSRTRKPPPQLYTHSSAAC